MQRQCRFQLLHEVKWNCDSFELNMALPMSFSPSKSSAALFTHRKPYFGNPWAFQRCVSLSLTHIHYTHRDEEISSWISWREISSEQGHYTLQKTQNICPLQCFFRSSLLTAHSNEVKRDSHCTFQEMKSIMVVVLTMLSLTLHSVLLASEIH